MLRFSKKVEYALISLMHMGQQSNGDLTTSRELARAFNIPQEVIGKVLQSLAKKGYITSVQGVKGGYQLSDALTGISLSGVIEAVDGPVRVVGCLDGGRECGCDQADYCNIRHSMETIQSRLHEFLGAISLADLRDRRFPMWQIPPRAGATPAKTLDKLPASSG